MGCNCGNTIKTNKDQIRHMAIQFAKVEKIDIQIHTWTQRGIGRLWDFEPYGYVDRGKGLVEVIRFRDYQSKNVLPDSEGIKSDSKKSGKPKRGGTGKVKSGSGEAKKGLDRNDEPVRDSEGGISAGEVEGDS